MKTEYQIKVEKRFWSNVDKNGPKHPVLKTKCWEWTRPLRGRYGRIKVKYKTVPAHRLSWEIHFGPIEQGVLVCHHCDNTKCIRPEHLFLGTNKDNTQDAVRKGRMSSGDRHFSRTQPEKLARGERHGSKTHPERVPRGDRSGSRTHPESRPKGEDVHCAILTESDVLEIRERHKSGGVSKSQLAREYGVKRVMICKLLNRTTWKHI